MKTSILSIAFMLCFVTQNAQVSSFEIHSVNVDSVSKNYYSQDELSPVYFNFHKRQLKDLNKNVINPIDFLNLCRTINDTLIQIQVARYDAFTRDKQRLGLISLGSGFAAMGFLGSAAANSYQENNMVSGTLIFLGVASVLVIPALAIYSTVPHQKRKTVLFRDLPVAYNYYVERHNNLSSK